MSWADNRFKQSMERRVRGKHNILMKKDGVIINNFKSVRETVKKNRFKSKWYIKLFIW